MKKAGSAVAPHPIHLSHQPGTFRPVSGNLRRFCFSHRDSEPQCFLCLLPVKPEDELITDLDDGGNEVTSLFDDQISACHLEAISISSNSIFFPRNAFISVQLKFRHSASDLCDGRILRSGTTNPNPRTGRPDRSDQYFP